MRIFSGESRIEPPKTPGIALLRDGLIKTQVAAENAKKPASLTIEDEEHWIEIMIDPQGDFTTRIGKYD